MIILPAIDIKDGQAVRLYQGDYGQVTTYDKDPVQVAQRFEQAGASWLHIVDLDGAAQGQPVNVGLIERIRGVTQLKIEVGGGIRTLAACERLLDLGIERVILGTVVLRQRELLRQALERWGAERIVVGLDARDGLVAISGWRETSRVRATELAEDLRRVEGVTRFVYTDIGVDGSLRGPNLAAMSEMQEVVTQAIPGGTEGRLIASGGVGTLADLHALARLGVVGTIVGKAIYAGGVELAQAIREIEWTNDER
jgi:phosphoribosylformimino-5-aminoimidazole carboxamide ribotide isomerase